MIVQITKTRDELFLLKEMLPIWRKYADGFVFLDDSSTDGTYEYLTENASEFNILKVIRHDRDPNVLDMESNKRQSLYDEAFKYSSKIICLDSDEYLDGEMTKQELESVLDQSKDHVFYLSWIQYTDVDQIRVDGKWASHLADRVASYNSRKIFHVHQMHSEHVPTSECKLVTMPFQKLFVAHLQWLDKESVAIKQYYWKVVDYVNKTRFGAKVIDCRGYDESVNNFNWHIVNFPFPLKVRRDVYRLFNPRDGYKYQFIVNSAKELNIPNLNDWGMGIHPV